jgi:metallo-beta-lactamase family protein
MGRDVPVAAHITQLDSMSAHADAGEIIRWLRGFAKPPRKTYLVHGEPTAQQALSSRIQSELGWDVHIPAHGETVQL